MLDFGRLSVEKGHAEKAKFDVDFGQYLFSHIRLCCLIENVLISTSGSSSFLSMPHTQLQAASKLPLAHVQKTTALHEIFKPYFISVRPLC